MVNSPEHTATTVAMTHSTSPERYANRIEQIAGDNWSIRPLDNREGNLTAQEILSAGNETGTLLGSGSMDYIAKPTTPDNLGELHINVESPQSKELVKALIYLIIQELRGENKIDFFGICFSAQALAMAMAVVETLIEQGLDIQKINSYAQLDRFLKGEPTAAPEHIVKQPSFKNPIAAVTTSELGVLTNQVQKMEDPLFEGTPKGFVDGIHANNQVILAHALSQIRESFARLGGTLDLLMIRDDIEIHRGRTRIHTRIATGFRLGKLHAVQWHPDYTTQGLAVGLEDVVGRGVLPSNYYRPLSGGHRRMEELILHLRNETNPEGSRILSN